MAHPSVTQYQAMVLEEQTIAQALPAQATPLFLDKLNNNKKRSHTQLDSKKQVIAFQLVCSHLCQLAIAPSTKSSNRYIFARDLAFFAVDFFSGDRGSDLRRVKSKDVLTLPGKSGFLINQVFGKTLQGNGSNVFGLKPIPGSPYCPVTNLFFYIALAAKMGIDLGHGFLSHVTDRNGNITPNPFVGSAVANRL